MVGRIANGERAIRPWLARLPDASDPTEVPPLGIAEWALNLVREGMFRVVNGERGTARAARLPAPDVAMAGKTGTSQVRRISRSERQTGVRKNEDKPWEERDHALFVAFTPYRSPRYAIAVVVEHGGSGSKAAAPIARDIMAKALELDPARSPATFTLERRSAPPRQQA